MLNETYYWSIPFGRWNGIPVRLHMLLVLAAVAIFGIEFHLIDQRPLMLGTAFATVVVGLFVVFLHIAAQLSVLRRFHRDIKAICVVPWGGIYHLGTEIPTSVRAQALTLGMVTNLFAMLVSLAILMPGSPETITEILNPFRPRMMDWANIDRSLLEIFCWLNFAMTLAALIPIAPLDMGYLLETWGEKRLHDIDPIQRYTMLFAVGQLFALGLFFVAYFVRDWTDGPLKPAWLWPVLLGITLFFSARQHYLRRLQETLPQSEYGWAMREQQTFTVAEKFKPEPYEINHPWSEMEADAQWNEWMKDNQESRAEARQAQEESEDAMLDEILDKVGRNGMESLTPEERELLHRVSQRYRNRQEIQESS